jgi:nucleoside phosphorylase
LSKKPNSFVFCALACEAKPLIKAWRLKKLSSSPHPVAIYINEQKVVVVTGIGKIAMAGAIGYVMALFANPDMPILLNLGIAGHKTLAVGDICLGEKISDSETGRSFYPPLTVIPPCNTGAIITHSKAHTAYNDDNIRDMEAVGFYEIAVKFSTSELIQVIKIISDNAQSPIDKINESAVETWINDKVAIVEALLNDLMRLRQPSVSDDPTEHLFKTLSTRFHFTAANASKLKALLQRWQLLKGSELDYADVSIRSASELLSWMEQELDGSALWL